MKKKKPQIKEIKAVTYPNGFGLTVNGHEYMYMSPNAFVEGVIKHIGLQELEEANTKALHHIMTAVVKWSNSPYTEKFFKDIADLEAERNESKRTCQVLTNRCNNLSARYERLSDELSDVRAELAIAQSRAEKYTNARHEADVLNAMLKAERVKYDRLWNEYDDMRKKEAAKQRAAKARTKRTRDEILETNLDEKTPKPRKKAEKPVETPKEAPESATGKKQPTTPPRQRKGRGGRKKADQAVIRELERQAKEQGLIL